jgi:hypothetical protein
VILIQGSRRPFPAPPVLIGETFMFRITP